MFNLCGMQEEYTMRIEGCIRGSLLIHFAHTSSMNPSSIPTWPDPMTFNPDITSKRKKGAQRPEFAPIWATPGHALPKPMRVHLFVNPYSGKKKGPSLGEQVAGSLTAAGVPVVQYRSEFAGHLVDLSRSVKAVEGDVFAVVGGDGSFSEVITGRFLCGTANNEVFALVPAGTGNSQAHDLGLHSVKKAVETVLSGVGQRLDLAKVDLTEGLPGAEKGRIVRYSHNLVTWGLGVDSTIRADKMRWMGPVRYDVGIVLSILANQRRTAVLEMDGHRMEDDFTLLLIQNSQTGGSQLPLAPGASLDDGWMDIGMLKSMTRRQVFKAFGMLKAEGRHVYHPRVDYHRFKTLTITTKEPSAVNVDGENLGSTPVSIEVLAGAVTVLVPPSEGEV